MKKIIILILLGFCSIATKAQTVNYADSIKKYIDIYDYEEMIWGPISQKLVPLEDKLNYLYRKKELADNIQNQKYRAKYLDSLKLSLEAKYKIKLP